MELYSGHMRSVDRLQKIQIYPMTVKESLGTGRFRYSSQVPCQVPGRYGFTVRVTPRGDSAMKYAPGLITWAS